MTRNHRLTLLLLSAALAGVVACRGGHSGTKTPTASPTLAGGVAGQTASAARTGQALGTPVPGVSAGSSPVVGADGSPIAAGASPGARLPPDVTVLPNGTATNPQGTPVVLPSPRPADTPPAAQATAAGQSGIVISVSAPSGPPDAAGDFTVDVHVSGVTTPYRAFNVYLTFDPAIISASSITAGPAVSPGGDSPFCGKQSPEPGAVGIGCTGLGESKGANGLLATIKFHRVSGGVTQLHLNSFDEGGATRGTFVFNVQSGGGGPATPERVTLTDGSVTLP